MIPFKKINITRKLIARVTNLMSTGMIGLGSEVFEFEKNLAEYVGSKYCVATDSCTSALFMSVRYEIEKLGLKTVSCPTMTVPLVANAIIEAGGKLFFTDDIKWVGSVYRLGGVDVWDSAHELERNMFKKFGKKAKVCYSFYPTKNIGSADGGAICTNDKRFADWARCAVTYGRDQGQKYKNSWEYEIVMRGWKRHYTNLQAVICDEQLKKLDKVNKRRTEIRNKFNGAFVRRNKSLYLYRLNVSNRDNFIKKMSKAGIQCGVHFKPLHMMKAFGDVPFDGDKKKVEKAYKHTVSIPFYNRLTDEEVDYIIDNVKKHADFIRES